MNSSCDVFIKSYRGDLPWLRWCLKSLRRFWKGDGEVVVVLPPDCVAEAAAFLHDRQRIVPQEELFKEGYSVQDRPPGYYFQQAVKLHADQYSQADLILFMDSDAVLTRECGPEDFLDPDGLPVIYHEAYEYFRQRHPGVYGWKQGVESILRVRVEHEFMRCLPLVYWAGSLKRFRDYVQRLHGRSTWDIVKYAQFGPFSEFNTLGAWAYTHDTARYKFVQAEHPGDNWPLKQYWSWGGLTPAIEQELQQLVG